MARGPRGAGQVDDTTLARWLLTQPIAEKGSPQLIPELRRLGGIINAECGEAVVGGTGVVAGSDREEPSEVCRQAVIQFKNAYGVMERRLQALFKEKSQAINMGEVVPVVLTGFGRLPHFTEGSRLKENYAAILKYIEVLIQKAQIFSSKNAMTKADCAIKQGGGNTAICSVPRTSSAPALQIEGPVKKMLRALQNMAQECSANYKIGDSSTPPICDAAARDFKSALGGFIAYIQTNIVNSHGGLWFPDSSGSGDVHIPFSLAMYCYPDGFSPETDPDNQRKAALPIYKKVFMQAAACLSMVDRFTNEDPAASVCGNGKVEKKEECDDGNTTAGDGCDSTCREEQPAEAAPVAEPPYQCPGHETTLLLPSNITTVAGAYRWLKSYLAGHWGISATELTGILGNGVDGISGPQAKFRKILENARGHEEKLNKYHTERCCNFDKLLADIESKISSL